MKKLRLFLGAITVSLVLLFITKVNAASTAAMQPPCYPAPNEVCKQFDPQGNPIYKYNYRGTIDPD